jgi:RimJ/RimL family protein N-acetyltransferase
MAHGPLTQLETTPEEAAAIRDAIRTARGVDTLGGRREVLAPHHIPAFYELLSDPRVSAPIYVIPRPITLESVGAWAQQLMAARDRGEGLTLMNFSDTGELIGFTEIVVWPENATGEIGGALRADRQGAGEGPTGFVLTADWLFNIIGVRMICLTAALDNQRSQRMIDGAGFERRGEIDSVRPDGTTRRSVYWELMRENWRARRSA